MITTKDWKKMFAPPSIFEYIVQSIAGVLITMMDNSGTLDSHTSTRRCCLDYTRLKEEAKVGISLGYICADCKSKIKDKLGKKVFECINTINSMDWLGEVGDKGTVAYDLKKYFRIDLNKDTGFTKTTTDKIKSLLLGLSESAIEKAVLIVVAFLIGLILGTE